MHEKPPEHRDLISWLPPWVVGYDIQRLEVKADDLAGENRSWLCARPAAGEWDRVAEGMRAAGRRLKKIPVARIVEAIDRVASRWCDPAWPLRVGVRERVVKATGFSPQSVDRSFDLELRNYRAESLWRTLRREFGDPACLDGFVKDAELHGRTLAIGPDLVLALYTGNVPGLPALSMVRSLLVKAPVIAKVASGEPTFAAAFAESLCEEFPLFGEAVLVTYWGREERSFAAGVAKQAGAVVAYGGAAAIRSVREIVPAGVRIIEHGHKLSVGFVSRSYLSHFGSRNIASAIARDVAIFDQHACIAPQAYFIESTPAQARRLAAEIGSALAVEARNCPAGGLRPVDAARIRLARIRQQWQAVSRSGFEVWHADGFEWTVTLDDSLSTAEGIGHRFLRVIPVEGLSDAIAQLERFSDYLQNVGLGCTPEELDAAAMRFAAIGASRICEPGKMAEPSMMWRHDGQSCIADLTRRCDIEMHRSLPD